jgi:hypothetical protein
MCERLAELRRSLREFAAGLDAATLSVDSARGLVSDAAAIENMAGTLKALGAARVAEAGRAVPGAARSIAHELAGAMGCSVSSARQAIELGAHLGDQGGIDAAARAGRVSVAQAGLISGAAAADPSSEAELLEAATSGACLSELAQRCAEVKACSRPDPEAHRRAIHARRSLRHWCDPEGVGHLSAAGNPEDIARVMAAVEPYAEARFRSARAEGLREYPEAYAFDGLVALARDSVGPENAGSEGPRPRRAASAKLLLRVDLETLLRGFPTKGEVCEIAGYGPVSVSAVRELVDSGDAFVAAILTKGRAVVGVAHLGRRPSAHQQSALEWLYPTCAAKGCGARARLQADHRVDWAKTHFTVFDWLDLLCGYDHWRKTALGWALVEGVGKRDFVSPDDPRHPRNAHAPP